MAGCAKMSHFSGKCHWLKIVSPAEFKAPHKMMISIFAKNTAPFISYIKSVEHTLIEGHSKSYKCDDAPVILIRSSRQINFLKSSLSLSQQSLMISSIREAVKFQDHHHDYCWFLCEQRLGVVLSTDDWAVAGIEGGIRWWGIWSDAIGNQRLLGDTLMADGWWFAIGLVVGVNQRRCHLQILPNWMFTQACITISPPCFHNQPWSEL